MENSKKLIITLVCLVIVIIAGVLFLTLGSKKAPVAKAPEVTVGQAINAKEGQVIDGFPSEFALVDRATLTGSYKIPYTGFTQYTIQQETTMSLKDIYNLYLDYFNKNSFQIADKTYKDNVVAALYAKKDSIEVTMSASNLNGKRELVVSYKK